MGSSTDCSSTPGLTGENHEIPSDVADPGEYSKNSVPSKYQCCTHSATLFQPEGHMA